MDVSLSAAEKRLLLALPRDGSPVALSDAQVKAGFASEGEALQAAGAPQRHGLVELTEKEHARVQLTTEGQRIASLPESRAAAALAAGPLGLAEIVKRAGLSGEEGRVILGLLKKQGWADIEKGAAGPTLRARGTANIATHAPEQAFLRLKQGPADPTLPGAAELVERGLAARATRVERSMCLTPAGAKFATGIKGDDLGIEVNQVTPELIARWPQMSASERAKHHLRPFDIDVPVAPAFPGKAHPLSQMIAEIRDIFVSMGFQEIAGDYVEPAFWNLDTLFIPQDHSARDMQDTFYLKEPARLPVPEKLWETVREVQQSGGESGSTGWGGAFTKAESERALLRTHTTVTTIRHLAAHPKPPLKVFGIGRVFRNEAMDATHLPEFHQIEGIVVEEGANLAMLMGVLREFYTRLGFPEVKFRPSYYPYTEPSMDVAVKWQGRWLELGGSGIFRPEVTQPLGVPCNVLAWGLGLERLAMMGLGLKDIRQLYVSDIQWLREAPLR